MRQHSEPEGNPLLFPLKVFIDDLSFIAFLSHCYPLFLMTVFPDRTTSLSLVCKLFEGTWCLEFMLFTLLQTCLLTPGTNHVRVQNLYADFEFFSRRLFGGTATVP